MEHSKILSVVLTLIGVGVTGKTLLERRSTELVENTDSWIANTSDVTIAPVNPTQEPLIPQVALPIHLTVIILISVLVLILFIAIYVQLILVIWFGYKLISYQTVLLFNILLWAALRLTLYSFYYFHCCEGVGLLKGVAAWLLVASPTVLQYLSLAVLVRYFGEVSLAA